MAPGSLDDEPPEIVLSGGLRDQKTQAEIFEKGEYADCVFAVGQPPGGLQSAGAPPLEVYGLKPIFALQSEKFRELLNGPASYKCSQAGKERLWALDGYWIPNHVTPEAFQLVASYLYKLPLRLRLPSLHEVIEASSVFELPELSKACNQFGLEQYARRASLGKDEEGLDAMLRCLEAWHQSTGAEEELKVEWRRRLLERWPQETVLSSGVFANQLSLNTMRALLQAEEMHKNETLLWNAVLSWAKVQWDLGRRPPAAESADGKEELETGPGSKKLFGPRASNPPRERTGLESEWQRLLLPLSSCFQLQLLSPEAFALGLEGKSTGDESPGLIPELRSMLYAARRMAKQNAPPAAKAV